MTGDWERFRGMFWFDAGLGVSLDVSRLGWSPAELDAFAGPLSRAFAAMEELEAGAVANPDEGRRVGHYWLRDPDRAPTPEIAREIRETLEAVEGFAGRVLRGEIATEAGPPFARVLHCGIGGSALGPQFLSRALAPVHPPLAVDFLDNTDPDGTGRLLERIGADLPRTLVVVVSKSGGTPETRNAAEAVRAALRARGLTLPPRAVAVTGAGSALDRRAREEGWLARFPMWDYVGGRTSVCSAVGAVPALLQGIPFRELLAGARAMDALTRVPDPQRNPAALLAAAWHFATNGKGERDMVVLPYRDRLELFSRYLQQLVMESLGKERDLAGNVVHQGITVYGNKGSTDQHAYVQQLRDGVPNFFVTFLEVLDDGPHPRTEVEPGITAGDYLHGFLYGTRQALAEAGRPSLVLTLPDLSARSVGALLALFERAVGLYAVLVNVNAYHQPGVEAGKRAAAGILGLKARLLDVLAGAEPLTVEEAAAAAGADPELAFPCLRHLAANHPEVTVEGDPADPFGLRYRRK